MEAAPGKEEPSEPKKVSGSADRTGVRPLQGGGLVIGQCGHAAPAPPPAE